MELKIVKGIEKVPPKFIIHGVGGIGKTELGAAFPNPLFLRVENGAFAIPCDKTPHITDVHEFGDWIDFLKNQKHDYKTVVVDTGDELQSLKQKDLCAQANCESIMDFKGGWGKGSGAIRAYFDTFRYQMDELQKKGMFVVILVHNSIEKSNDPLTEPYDRHVLNFEKEITPKMFGWADCTLFVNYKISGSTKTDAGKKTFKPQASQPDRVIYTEERPSFLAKNRYNLPFEIDFSDPEPQGDSNFAGQRAARRAVDEILAGIRSFLFKTSKPKEKAAGKEKIIEGDNGHVGNGEPPPNVPIEGLST